MSIPQNYLVNLIEQIVDRKLASSVWLAIGVVSAYDNTKYLAKVQLSYEQVETPFIRIGMTAAGNTFGDKVPLAVGDEVVVAFYNATMESGVVAFRLYTDPSDLPPTTAAGERLMQHSSGSKIRFTTTGGVEVFNKDKAHVKVNADNSVEVANDKAKVSLAADGALEVSNAKGDLKIASSGAVELGNSSISLKMTDSGKVTLGGTTVELLALFELLITTLNGSSVPPVIPLVTPGVTGIMSPAMVTALNVIKTKLNTIKGP